MVRLFKAVLAEWIGALDLGSLVRDGEGSNPSVPNYLISDGGEWRDSVSSTRVDPALNGNLEKSGEGKEEGLKKHRMAGPHPPIALPG